MNYKDTLNLPKTDFSMKANLPQKEPVILEKWEKQGIYEFMRKKCTGRPKFILHDGPPYANGNIHMGHVLNKVLKDIVVKYKTMRGYDAPFVPGWDCHGLPIEYQLLKEMGKSKHDLDKVDFRKQARQFAQRYVDIQREEFKRLGVFGDWENPYLTMNPEYASRIVRCFGKLYDKGYIYKGLKPILWCPHCETALAEAEVEYDNHISPSLYVKFKVKKGLPKDISNINNVSSSAKASKDVSVVIWTTTPWTLPANKAIAIRPEYTYAFVKKDNPDEVLVIVKQLVPNVMETVGINKYEIVAELRGQELMEVITQHPFIDRESPVVFSEHVTLECGTGCVHTAPGHGEEDYEVGLHYGLEIYAPVNEKGSFMPDIEHFGGMNVFKANHAITDFMAKNGTLLHAHEVTHTYPHCWRCKQPIIFRATEQWFLGIDKHNLRQQVIDVIQHIPWIPAVGERRIGSMVGSRPDWCLSRQRLWGVPIPVFYCQDCGAELVSSKVMENIQYLVEKEGSDVWFMKDAKELLPKDTKCSKCGKKNLRKEEDIIDVWFDSGVSHEAVLKRRSDQECPADLYLEGSDQHRGWFQTSLITAVGMRGKAPFKKVLTHGFVVDGEGRKMSKSMGNVITPQDILPRYGADILRLWVASIDYTGDVPISEEILGGLADAYRKLRNTFRFLLGNLYDFVPSRNGLSLERLTDLDRWMLGRAHQLLHRVTVAYERYQFHEVYHTVYNFCVVDLSAVYLDILKDRLYTYYADSWERRSAQTVMAHILEVLIRVIAPLLPFTAEEIWQYLPLEMREPKSVHLAGWIEAQDKYVDKILETGWGSPLLKIRAEVLKVLEESRRNGIIGNSLGAKVELLLANEELKGFLKAHESFLPTMFIASQVEVKDYVTDDPDSKNARPATDILGLYILVKKAKGAKCSRCWNWSLDVGKGNEHPLLCSRCIEVLKTIGFTKK